MDLKAQERFRKTIESYEVLVLVNYMNLSVYFDFSRLQFPNKSLWSLVQNGRWTKPRIFFFFLANDIGFPCVLFFFINGVSDMYALNTI